MSDWTQSLSHQNSVSWTKEYILHVFMLYGKIMFTLCKIYNKGMLQVHNTCVNWKVAVFFHNWWLQSKGQEKNVGMTALGNFGIDTWSDSSDMLVGFAEGNHLNIMNTFFDPKTNKKWTWKSPNGETKIEIDFILTNKLNTVKECGRFK